MGVFHDLQNADMTSFWDDLDFIEMASRGHLGEFAALVRAGHLWHAKQFWNAYLSRYCGGVTLSEIHGSRRPSKEMGEQFLALQIAFKLDKQRKT